MVTLHLLGQLPFLTHGLHSVAGFHGIVKYLSTSYHIESSATLDAKQKAQLSARLAHVESSLGDLTVSRLSFILPLAG